MEPLVSVIVPVYNVERYVQQCLESLVNQTLKEIEIIIVNDGSTDGSAEICNKYAKMDSRIVYITKENGGLSEARNVGLKYASADYIGFVDSDDYVDLDFFKVLYDLTQKNNAKISVGAIRRVDENNITYREDKSKEDTIFSTYDAMKSMLTAKGISNAVWNKIFYKALLNGEEFPVGKLYEDEFFTYRIIDKTDIVCVSSRVAYNYKINPNSITHGVFSEREFDRIDASLIRIDYLKKRYPALVKDAKKYLVWDCLIILSKMDKYDKKYDEKVLKNIRNGFWDYVFSSSSITGKLFVIIATISPRLAVVLYRIIRKK